MAQNPGKHFLMGADPRLPKMPEKPTLIDFFKHRFASTNHLLQSATHALKAGHDEKVVLACLLHDIGVVSFIRCDHGYWGAQLIEPYVDEEVSWAVRVHQALRFFPDESVGYKYPDMYVKFFGADYKPEPYIVDGVQARPQPQVLHDRAPDLRERHLFVRSRTPRSTSTISSTSSAAISSSRRRGSASTTRPSSHMWRTHDVADAVLVSVDSLHVIAGLDPAIHPLSKMFYLFCEDGPAGQARG